MARGDISGEHFGVCRNDSCRVLTRARDIMMALEMLQRHRRNFSRVENCVVAAERMEKKKGQPCFSAASVLLCFWHCDDIFSEVLSRRCLAECTEDHLLAELTGGFPRAKGPGKRMADIPAQRQDARFLQRLWCSTCCFICGPLWQSIFAVGEGGRRTSGECMDKARGSCGIAPH